MATVEKGDRSVTKFRGGYDDPYSYDDECCEPDNSLPGERCIEIDYTKWTEMSTPEAFLNKYVAISYKHDLRYPDRLKGEDFRAMRAPKVVIDEVNEAMRREGISKYWHDGGFPLWKDKKPNCKGSYPYLLEGGKVLIVPPFCSRKVIDVRMFVWEFAQLFMWFASISIDCILDLLSAPIFSQVLGAHPPTLRQQRRC